MKYEISDWIFDKIPNVCFGVIIGKNLKNSETSQEDSDHLTAMEEVLRQRIAVEDLKTTPEIAVYRDALKLVEINPNKYTNSVEAMSKRVLKGNSLTRINALVDLCNAIALEEGISLGAHDMKDIDDDLSVRLSIDGDIYRPFGKEEFEDVPAGEVVFTCGNKVQTRQWLWRQSELGKITLESSDIFFQLVGFSGEHFDRLTKAMKQVENLVSERFDGKFKSFIVTKDNPSIEF